uniref:Uncharacterized protein n=2 Tax=Lotharella oceanica TaxID=641309 RepID=A0A7S2TTL6_9EUKA|mmetsp:Transcript_2901/g.5604  ORF Transcript_2901/g.5604 Transcript_2901/m.5604 type:complete len:126 (+) Transcript_2901:65-442(+)
MPKWVVAYPAAQAEKKAAYYQEFGSPNVFDEYDPHVTIARFINVKDKKSKDELRNLETVCADAFEKAKQEFLFDGHHPSVIGEGGKEDVGETQQQQQQQHPQQGQLELTITDIRTGVPAHYGTIL